MAQIVKRIGKNGTVKYVIRVSDGYSAEGKQRRKSMTWTPPPGLSPKKEEKALQLAAIKFEEAVHSGTIQDGSIKFYVFSEKWIREYAQKQLKAKTVDSYKRILQVLNQKIGHIRLQDLKAAHLNSLYYTLQEQGKRRDIKYAAKVDLRMILKSQGLIQHQLAESANLSARTIHTAVQGNHISLESANKIAKALGKKRSLLFEETQKESSLNANTIRTYHRCLSSVLTKAVKWGYIPYNPAKNAELPKLAPKEAAYLDEAAARRLLLNLQAAPIKYRAAITFDLLSGLRRGELLGLRWCDVDFAQRTIRIVQTSSYVTGKGVYVDTPKNQASARLLKLSPSAFEILKEMQEWQNAQKVQCGTNWKNKDDRIFTNEQGLPLYPDTLSKWFRRFIRKHNLPNVHIHSLRHSYASLMIAEGIPLVVVSRRLGHSQVSTTANIYSHVIKSADERASEVVEIFSDVLTPTKPNRYAGIK